MMIVTKPGTPEELEQRAAELEGEADRCDAGGRPRSGKGYRDRARRLREQARALRARRTDGVRFG